MINIMNIALNLEEIRDKVYGIQNILAQEGCLYVKKRKRLSFF